MLQFIRKHQLLGGTLLFLVLASFIIFMIPGGDPFSMLQGGRVPGMNPIDGKPVTFDEFNKAQKMSRIYVRLFSRSQADNEAEQREVYNRLILQRKLDQMQVSIPMEAVVTEIKNIFKDPTTQRYSKTFYENVVVGMLERDRLSETDFFDFIKQQLGIRQLAQALSLSDTMVTPQEGREHAKRDLKKAKANLVVFHNTNYTDKVKLDPAELMQYYTNNMPSYRTSEQRNVTFIQFNPTNYLAQAESQATELDALIDSQYTIRKDTLNDDEGNPLDEAAGKAKLKEELLLSEATRIARKEAYQFTKDIIEQTGGTNMVATNKLDVFKSQALLRGLDPVATDWFNQFGLISERTPGADGKKTRIDVGSEFNSAAFRLTSSDIFTQEPVQSRDNFYFMALDQIKPTEIQPYDQVKARVESGYRRDRVRELVKEDGESFYTTLTNEFSKGEKTFSQIVTNAGYQFVSVPQFDRSTTTLTNFKSTIGLSTIKNTAFGLGQGEISQFVPSGQNGYIVQVTEFIEPTAVEVEADMTNAVSQIQTQMRLGTGGFNDWMQQQLAQSGFLAQEEEQ